MTSPIPKHNHQDTIIDISHSYLLLDACTNPVEPLFVDGAGHNDIELHDQYMDRLVSFVLSIDAPPHTAYDM